MECSCTTELISQRCGLVLVSVLHRAVFVQGCCSAKISDIVQNHLATSLISLCCTKPELPETPIAHISRLRPVH